MQIDNFQYVTDNLRKISNSRLNRKKLLIQVSQKMAATLILFEKNRDLRQIRKAFVRIMTAKRPRVSRFSCI